VPRHVEHDRAALAPRRRAGATHRESGQRPPGARSVAHGVGSRRLVRRRERRRPRPRSCAVRTQRAGLSGLGLPSRLVAADGRVVTVAGWPAEEAQPDGHVVLHPRHGGRVPRAAHDHPRARRRRREPRVVAADSALRGRRDSPHCLAPRGGAGGGARDHCVLDSFAPIQLADAVCPSAARTGRCGSGSVPCRSTCCSHWWSRACLRARIGVRAWRRGPLARLRVLARGAAPRAGDGIRCPARMDAVAQRGLHRRRGRLPSWRARQRHMRRGVAVTWHAGRARRRSACSGRGGIRPARSRPVGRRRPALLRRFFIRTPPPARRREANE